MPRGAPENGLGPLTGGPPKADGSGLSPRSLERCSQERAPGVGRGEEPGATPRGHLREAWRYLVADCAHRSRRRLRAALKEPGVLGTGQGPQRRGHAPLWEASPGKPGARGSC